MSDTLATIRPILIKTYGRGGMVDALANVLAEKIDAYDPQDDRDSRERMVMLVCWDWMTGGTTAQFCASDIERALNGVTA